MNQVPISSYDHYTGDESAENYRAFLDKYNATFLANLTETAGKSVCFDNYPFIQEQSDGILGYGAHSGILDDYLLNVLVAANSAKDYNASTINGEANFGICIQTFEASSTTDADVKRDITSSAEVTFQLYTGMACGADLFEYFTYNSGSEFSGIMNADGTKRIYDLVMTANKEALCFSDVITNFTWQGIETSAGTTNHANGDAFSQVSTMLLGDVNNGVLSSISSTDDAVVGCFTKDEQDGYMLVNYNDPVAVTGNNSITVNFAGCTKARVYTGSNGVLQSEIVELTDGAYTFTVAPGSACFVIPA